MKGLQNLEQNHVLIYFVLFFSNMKDNFMICSLLSTLATHYALVRHVYNIQRDQKRSSQNTNLENLRYDKMLARTLSNDF